MPASAGEMLDTLFAGWLTDAIDTTFVVGVAICVARGLCALALRSHVERGPRADGA